MNTNITLKDYQLAYRQIIKRERTIGFIIHAIIYAFVNIGLIILNLTTSPEAYWFLWPLCCWGFGLAMHAVGIFVSANREMERNEALAEKRAQERLSNQQ